MALDGLVVHAIVHELQCCVGGRINKIHQPSKHQIVIQLRGQGTNIKLLLSANPTYPRVHLTDENFVNPKEAPMFCMLLRKHCENGTIESIEQVETERVIHIQVRHRDELGDTRIKTIIVELMGRHSNIILVDAENNKILDGIHHVTPAISTYRIVMPGCEYMTPPDQDKHNPMEVTKEKFLSLMTSDNDQSDPNEAAFDSAIVQQFSGISPLIAREIVYRSSPEAFLAAELNEGSQHMDDSQQHAAILWQTFSAVIGNVQMHQYEPFIVEASSGKLYFSVMPLTHLMGKATSYRTISQCLEAYYGDKAERDVIKQRVADLLRFLHNEKSKNVKKLDKLAETLEKAEGADQYRVIGEMLTASLHLVQRGDKQIEVINYYDELQQKVMIAIDPQLSPADNAQRYFKKYSKMKNSVTVVQQQIKSSEAEIEYLASLQQQLDNASITDIDEIRDELVEQGYIRDRNKKTRKKKKSDKPLLNCYMSSEGIPIYVGKNNTQNDYLSNRFAHVQDTWLHTKDIPGSHVIIKSPTFNEQTLDEAAQLAAYFSQGRESSQVPVDYTLVRHVRKPNGAKPGYVIYEQQKTLFVTPNEQLIKQLEVVLK